MTQTAVKVAYQVTVTFCNGQEFVHAHYNVTEAAREYAFYLSLAIEPEQIQPPAKHVRNTTFTKIPDNDYTKLQHVNSGIFPCEHNQHEEY